MTYKAFVRYTQMDPKRSRGYSYLPHRNWICTEIHHRLLSTGQCQKLYYPELDTGIQGNERADEAAKAALSSTVSAMKCPVSDFIPELTMLYREVWQAEWDGCSANKLHSVKPHLGYCSVTHLSRRDAVILRRLRIGHTRVTHRYLLTGNSQPLCDECKL